MEEVQLFDFAKGEILLVNKPLEWTSFDVVRKLKGKVQAKIGHGGTLDPLATGLMVLATGAFTKQLTALQNLPKEYRGAFYLGATTPSYDLETEVRDVKDISDINEAAVHEAARSFVGRTQQVPPMYSAVKIAGTRAYKHARQGREAALQPRTIEVAAFDIEKIELPLVYFRIACSKGTYIRSIAHDMGRKLGAGAYLHQLCRTRIGEYRLEDAWEVSDLLDEIDRQYAAKAKERQKVS